MKTRTIEVYNCDFCNKLYQRKHAAEIHEGGCASNPANHRACFGCTHLTKKDTVVYLDTYCGEDEIGVRLFYCPERAVYLYPPKVEAKGNAFELGDEPNEPMPAECALFKSNSIY